MRRYAKLLAVLLIALMPGASQAERIVADLSDHLIAITTGFTGSNVLLFGATEVPGDIVVVVEGPPADMTIRRKDRVAGIWVNTDEMTLTGMPVFYALGASRAPREILSGAVARTHTVGAEWLRPDNWSALDEGRRLAFLQALIRARRRQELYPAEVADVRFPGSGLFRTTIHFPANVPTGAYRVRILFVRDGAVVGGQTTPLYVNKVGLSARVFDFAHDHGWAYGLIAIVIAAVAGWIAERVFRRS